MRIPIAVLVFATLVGAAGAQDDVAKEIRLAALDGRFGEADGLLAKAPKSVQDDAELHLFLAAEGAKAARGGTGEERRPALRFARNHYGRAAELKPAGAAVVGAVQAARDLADLEIAAKRLDGARAEAKWAVETGEAARTAGLMAPEAAIAVARAHALRASLGRTAAHAPEAVEDAKRAAQLVREVAEGNEKAAALLGEAATALLGAARLVHDQIPLPEEKRDEEALAAALDHATRACNAPGAGEPEFGVHLAALRATRLWGVPIPAGQKPFMQELAPAVEGLKLMVPRAKGWTRVQTDIWDLQLDRLLEGDNGTVQLLLKRWDSAAQTMGRSWVQLAEVAPRRLAKYRDEFEQVTDEVAPEQLTDGKKQLEVWHYEVAGRLKTGRPQRVAEWIWMGDRKRETVLQLKVLDWRVPSDVREPDLVAFVASAIGEGVWPRTAPVKPPKKK